MPYPSIHSSSIHLSYESTRATIITKLHNNTNYRQKQLNSSTIKVMIRDLWVAELLAVTFLETFSSTRCLLLEMLGSGGSLTF